MAIKIGDTLPHFVTKDNNGNDFDSLTVIGQRPVVIYFYPKNDTPGCTAEACSFRDEYADFRELGAEIIGISSDSVESHQKFIQKYQLPFLLLADEGKKIRKLFGVPTALFGLLPGRVTYIADKTGTVRMVYDSLSASGHITAALKAIKEIV